MPQSIQLSALIFLLGLGSTHLNAAGGEDETGVVNVIHTTITVRPSDSSTTSANSNPTRPSSQRDALRNIIQTKKQELADMDALIISLMIENRQLCQEIHSYAGTSVMHSMIPLSQEDSESGDEGY